MQKGEKWLLLLGVVAAIGVTAIALFHPDQGIRELLDRRAQRQELDQQIDQLRSRKTSLEREVIGLRENPRSIEARAREDLGMIRPGESVYLLPERHAPSR